MNILVLGAGGREHALVWKLRQSPAVERIFALPGSDGIAALATCLPGDPCDAASVIAAIQGNSIDLTVVGPEAPLAAGIADAVRAAGHRLFGPSRAAAQLESSKVFAKHFMLEHGIPTPRFLQADQAAAAHRGLERFGYPVVVKADGLAAGKGVVIAATPNEARAAVDAMLGGAMVGAAGRVILIEECLAGPELSLLAITDGERFLCLPAARDHKRLGEGDCGPNTGGMGAFSTDALCPPDLTHQIERDFIQPTLRGMQRAGTPFQGVLYCGLMLTSSGPRLLEFNARFGDPETQAILPRWGGDLARVLFDAAEGRLLPRPIEPTAPASACVVLAAAGYPAAPQRDQTITGLDPTGALPGGTVFHSGTRRAGLEWRTHGGRVLCVAATAPHLKLATARCYHGVEHIQFAGMQFRRDIGIQASL